MAGLLPIYQQQMQLQATYLQQQQHSLGLLPPPIPPAMLIPAQGAVPAQLAAAASLAYPVPTPQGIVPCVMLPPAASAPPAPLAAVVKSHPPPQAPRNPKAKKAAAPKPTSRDYVGCEKRSLGGKGQPLHLDSDSMKERRRQQWKEASQRMRERKRLADIAKVQHI